MGTHFEVVSVQSESVGQSPGTKHIESRVPAPAGPGGPAGGGGGTAIRRQAASGIYYNKASNITTFLAAFFLFAFYSRPVVKGFTSNA